MKKILIANRGEIAIRVIRTAKKMGIKTVAVYSTIDRNAPHVRFADEAVLIGEAPSNQSYLLGNKIIEVAKNLNVDAIHPGYGFLSENAHFAEACEKNNIVFIGPKSKAIKIMGSKLAAKEAVKAYNIPMVPGTEEAITDIPKAKIIAKEIGFPILIKASAGGGGKGMRVVENEMEFESQMQRAISEAINAFGDGAVFIEKYVTSPRHIEIQIMADTHGNVVHLFERECSIQRRHQKVIEEAPSAILTPELRSKMGEAAIKVAKSCDYVGAGTVEFLLDDHHNFYFLEMNTRLQVEHPVTELITNTDLVELQIRVARGEVLPITQENLKINGHALELRVYAEDPLNDFLPSVGNLEVYKLPEGKNIRVDNGFEQGMDIPIYYDPMLSKLITYGKTREEAIELMITAIQNYQIEGIETTLPFGSFVCEHDAFRSGNFNTHFVKKHYSPEALINKQQQEAKIAALIAVKKYLEDQKLLRIPVSSSSIQ
ncbi:acetyl-CoA carboxylase biotin carboxylase subunit [Polaribacter sp. R2A056_3_33]|uniref:acetyl-CoA carboxylase biotin carboxylase subunit n=1 Tax=Polaribacter sp. R2A056_3_33 TaxID=2745563 RepID=UPI001C4F176E|nr:acetyl-CoA carboxylase biotin carboxylase subunit [Polaribacter sp. R2A056_3_33]QXP70512.1 acetyl-CoA carboxylase biotin carboxylase subunit [Polaribacter sp. R2A056_3_33]